MVGNDGAMIAIAPGSPLQLLTALAVCSCYLLLTSTLAPYRGVLEDQLAGLTNFALSASLLMGFALITDGTADDPNPKNRQWFDAEIVGTILILFNVLPLLFVMWAAFMILLRGPAYGMRRTAAATAATGAATR